MHVQPPMREVVKLQEPAGLHRQLERPTAHPVARLIRPPAPVRSIAAGLALLLPLLIALLLLLPWQQARWAPAG